MNSPIWVNKTINKYPKWQLFVLLVIPHYIAMFVFDSVWKGVFLVVRKYYTSPNHSPGDSYLLFANILVSLQNYKFFTTLPFNHPCSPPVSTGSQEPRKMKMQLTAGWVDQLWTKAEWISQPHCLESPDTSYCKDPHLEEYWMS